MYVYTISKTFGLTCFSIQMCSTGPYLPNDSIIPSSFWSIYLAIPHIQNFPLQVSPTHAKLVMVLLKWTTPKVY